MRTTRSAGRAGITIKKGLGFCSWRPRVDARRTH